MTSRLPNGARLTPGRVRSMTFRLARLGHRGLDEDDVRDFCGQVEAELTQLLLERVPFLQQLRQFCFHLVAEAPHIILVKPTMAQPGQAEGHRPDAAGGEPGPVRQMWSHGTRSP